jgi:hypothetical protein
LATSISYNWTQTVDSALFNIAITTENTMATMSISTRISLAPTSNSTVQIATILSIAIKMETILTDVPNDIVLILAVFLVTTV